MSKPLAERMKFWSEKKLSESEDTSPEMKKLVSSERSRRRKAKSERKSKRVEHYASLPHH